MMVGRVAFTKQIVIESIYLALFWFELVWSVSKQANPKRKTKQNSAPPPQQKQKQKQKKKKHRLMIRKTKCVRKVKKPEHV